MALRSTTYIRRGTSGMLIVPPRVVSPALLFWPGVDNQQAVRRYDGRLGKARSRVCIMETRGMLQRGSLVRYECTRVYRPLRRGTNVCHPLNRASPPAKKLLADGGVTPLDWPLPHTKTSVITGNT